MELVQQCRPLGQLCLVPLEEHKQLKYRSEDGDYIQMLVIEAFRDAESFYATLAHESTHWTKHPSQLNRSFCRKA